MGYGPALGSCPLLPLVNVLVYLLSPLLSRGRTKDSRSDLEPDDWCWFLGLLLLGDVLLLRVLLGGPLWLVEVALISSSKLGDVSFRVLPWEACTCLHPLPNGHGGGWRQNSRFLRLPIGGTLGISGALWLTSDG